MGPQSQKNTLDLLFPVPVSNKCFSYWRWVVETRTSIPPKLAIKPIKATLPFTVFHWRSTGLPPLSKEETMLYTKAKKNLDTICCGFPFRLVKLDQALGTSSNLASNLSIQMDTVPRTFILFLCDSSHVNSMFVEKTCNIFLWLTCLFFNKCLLSHLW